MKTTLTIYKAGRVVIPKPLRDELHLNPGDTLELELQGEIMTMRPVRPAAPCARNEAFGCIVLGSLCLPLSLAKCFRPFVKSGIA